MLINGLGRLAVSLVVFNRDKPECRFEKEGIGYPEQSMLKIKDGRYLFELWSGGSEKMHVPYWIAVLVQLTG